MISGPLCVECSSKVGKLYTEYSEGNIKLTRCANCDQVADKYIEFELILVIVDIIRHRVQAYRHLLFNREPICFAKWDFIRSLFLSVLCVNVLLRIVLLNCMDIPNPTGRDLTLDILVILSQMIVLSFCDHILSILPIFVFTLWGFRRQTIWYLLRSHRARTLYLAVALPELGKILGILLETWDKEPASMLLIGLLIASIQHVSISAATADTSPTPLLAVLAGIGLKIAFRIAVHNSTQVVALGLVL